MLWICSFYTGQLCETSPSGDCLRNEVAAPPSGDYTHNILVKVLVESQFNDASFVLDDCLYVYCRYIHELELN